MTKGGTGGRKEEGGGRSATGDGKICRKDGMTGINPVAAGFGLEYFYSLLDRIISLWKIMYFRNGCGAGEFCSLHWACSLVSDTTLEAPPGLS